MLGEDIAAGEGGFLQIAKEAEAGFDGRAVGREVIAVERKAHFEAQRVACAEAAGGGTGGDEFFPERDAIGSRAEELEAVLTGVARAANDGSTGKRGDAVSWGQCFAGKNACENLRGLRSLDRHAGPLIALVAHRGALAEVTREPGDILVDFRGIDHEKIFLLCATIGDEVIDHAPVFIEHDRVLAFADCEPRKVVCEEAVELVERVGTADEDLTHVRDVENADLLANCLVLIDDRAVLHGHVPSGKGHRAGAEGEVGGFERRMAEIGHWTGQDCEGAWGLSIGHRKGGQGDGKIG